jgi:hypothetical protein
MIKKRIEQNSFDDPNYTSFVGEGRVTRPAERPWRHDAMAAQIIVEFNLQLPRDRELIRQLTFVRVQQGHLGR